jgi:hypothetical protein
MLDAMMNGRRRWPRCPTTARIHRRIFRMKYTRCPNDIESIN